jgi:glyoxylase-like metal-dependent hydrolase (beta-lactamase superfamily II)
MSLAVNGQNPPASISGIKTVQLAANLYLLQGVGCSVAALTGPDGVLLVDSGSAGHEDLIIAAVRAISSAPIRVVINTNARIDHTGGNEAFAKLGASIMGRPQLRERLAHPIFSANGMRVALPPVAPDAALPTIVYDAPTALYMNGEQVELIPIPHGYSDGDSAVRFVKADVIMTGELFQSVAYPNIDRANGGTVSGLVSGLNAILARSSARTRIIPGQDEPANRDAVASQRDMILVLSSRVDAMIHQGKSQEDMIAANLNADYPTSRLGRNRIIRDLYSELEESK